MNCTSQMPIAAYLKPSAVPIILSLLPPFPSLLSNSSISLQCLLTGSYKGLKVISVADFKFYPSLGYFLPYQQVMMFSRLCCWASFDDIKLWWLSHQFVLFHLTFLQLRPRSETLLNMDLLLVIISLPGFWLVPWEKMLSLVRLVLIYKL